MKWDKQTSKYGLGGGNEEGRRHNYEFMMIDKPRRELPEQ